MIDFPSNRIQTNERLRRLIDAVVVVERETSLALILGSATREACELVSANYGAFGVVNESRDGLSQFITAGLTKAEEDAIGERPIGRGLLGSILTDPRVLALDDLHEHPASVGFPANHPEMRTLLVVPVRANEEVFGGFYLSEKIDGTKFSEEDAAVLSILALITGTSIEKAILLSQVGELALTEDRDRIARDLHDNVIQRLFAVGLVLQGTARMVDRPEVVDRIIGAVASLDVTIRQLRTAIFDLELAISREGLRRSVLDLLHELTPVLGISPRVTFNGAVDSSLPPTLLDNMLATLREALTNVGKHAEASGVVVTIAVGDELRLIVADDGRGITPSDSGAVGLGLKNMRERAEQLGGTMELGRSREGGTRMIWQIPISGPTTAQSFEPRT